MDVRLPNGTIIKNVPEGTSKEEIRVKAINAGYAKAEDFPDAQKADVPHIDPTGQIAPNNPTQIGYLSPEERENIVDDKTTLGLSNDTWGQVGNTLNALGPAGMATIPGSRAVGAGVQTGIGAARAAGGTALASIPPLAAITSAASGVWPMAALSALASLKAVPAGVKHAKKGADIAKRGLHNIKSAVMPYSGFVDEVQANLKNTHKLADFVDPPSVGSAGTKWTSRIEALEDAIGAATDAAKGNIGEAVQKTQKLILKYTSNSQKALGVNVPDGTKFIERKNGVSFLRLPSGERVAAHGKNLLKTEQVSLLREIPENAEVVKISPREIRYILDDHAFIYDGVATRPSTITRADRVITNTNTNINVSGNINQNYNSAYTELMRAQPPEGYTLIGVHNKIPYYRSGDGKVVAATFGKDGPTMIDASLPSSLSKNIPKAAAKIEVAGSRTQKRTRAELEALRQTLNP
jgi:hypothetical protein